jgi:hypothetical protein
MNGGSIHIRTTKDADRLIETIRVSARRAHDWIAAQNGDPLDMLKRMKFEPVGFHPVDDRALNVVEQINQTWTYFVAASAAKQLLELHPDVGGFHLAPGAHASLELDVMSDAPGMVGAETFAAVDPRNNRKLFLDLQKMVGRSERHRYVFFMSPLHPDPGRLPRLERDGVEVWSLRF